MRDGGHLAPGTLPPDWRDEVRDRRDSRMHGAARQIMQCSDESPPYAADPAAGKHVLEFKMNGDVGGLRPPRRAQRAGAIYHTSLSAVGAAVGRRCPGGASIKLNADSGMNDTGCGDKDPVRASEGLWEVADA